MTTGRNPPSRSLATPILRRAAYLAAAGAPAQRIEGGVPLPIQAPTSQQVPATQTEEVNSAELLQVAIDHYNMVHHHMMDDTDLLLDILPLSDLAPATLPAAPGNEIVFYQYRVPAGQKWVVNQYVFFAGIDNTPVVPVPVIFAFPLELIGLFDFHIRVNGRNPIYNAWPINTAPPVLNDGIVLLSDRPMDVMPDFGGIHFIVPGGAMLELAIRRVAAGAPPRTVQMYGARIRGFITPDKE